MTAPGSQPPGGTASPAASREAGQTGAAASQLRLAIISLLSFAATEEELLLAGAGQGSQPDGDAAGSPQCWAAVPVVAHNTEFKQQQVQRLAAISDGGQPPEFAEVDHQSAAVYQRYRAQPADQVASQSRAVSRALLDRVTGTCDADLLDPARHRWLHGRQLGLQIIVRGFWHPTGHIADYYLQHGEASRAIALQEQAVRTAEYAAAPPAALGMACYSLACARAVAGLTGAAADALRRAIALNADLRAKSASDPDLTVLRAAGLAG